MFELFLLSSVLLFDAIFAHSFSSFIFSCLEWRFSSCFCRIINLRLGFCLEPWNTLWTDLQMLINCCFSTEQLWMNEHGYIIDGRSILDSFSFTTCTNREDLHVHSFRKITMRKSSSAADAFLQGSYHWCKIIFFTWNACYACYTKHLISDR